MRISRVPIVARMQIVMGSPLIRRSLFSSNRSPQTIELGQPYSTDQIFDPFLAAIGCLCRVSIHARARTHTEVRCRCSFESFRDNSSRQINLFSPRSNLFSLRETCFYISKSRRSLPGAPLPFGVGNRAVTPATYIYFSIGITRLPDFPFVSSLISAITRFSFVAPRFHYPRVTQELRRKNRSLIGPEGIPIGVVRFASPPSPRKGESP